jgi:hypothetical protein
MRIETSWNKELVRLALSWVPDVEVLAPRILCERVREKLRNASAGGRLRHSHGAGVARPFGREHDNDLHTYFCAAPHIINFPIPLGCIGCPRTNNLKSSGMKPLEHIGYIIVNIHALFNNKIRQT